MNLTERIRTFMDKNNHHGGNHLAAIQRSADMVANVADILGVVLTVTQRPRLPLAMGNYDTVVEVRPARVMAEKGGAA